jgi:hypothetical protein
MNLHVDTWFERDRAMVSLVNSDNNEVVIEWWDQDVGELVEMGWLSPDDWLRSATEYAQHLGVLPSNSK